MGIIMSPVSAVSSRGISPTFRSIVLVLILTSLNTWVQCFIKDHKMHWREKEFSSSYSLFSA